MATIDDLAESISEMSDPQVFAYIRNMRNMRRKFKKKKPKKKTSKKPVKKTDVDKVLNKLSKEETIELLKRLKGGKK